MDYVFKDSNYFGRDFLFAVLLNLLTYKSYAQVTLAFNTVEIPILQACYIIFRNFIYPIIW